MAYIGELASILASLCYSLTAVIFTLSGQKVGSEVTNRARVLIALGYLLIINLILFSSPLPFNAGQGPWFWLTLSGIFGLALGDAFLFRSYMLIGPRLGMLLMSLAPIIGAVMAWALFGETLTFWQMAGIVITLIGIGWVILTHNSGEETQAKAPVQGIIFGILAAAGQAIGLVLSKQGMPAGFSPFAGNAIRMLAAVFALWVMTLLQGKARITVKSMRENPGAMKIIALGALIGPVLGVTASLFAVQHAAIGVASTLMALPPIFLLPIGYFFFKERFGWQAVAGTLVAMLGVTLLFV
jgi:drug/metabolite transporter (DMT)-like permease